MNKNEDLEKIRQNQSQKAVQREYVVRGAITKCSNGEKEVVINLPSDHGKYIQGTPQIDVQDSNANNIGSFGICKKTNHKCVPNLSPWINGNENERMWDQNTLQSEATVMAADTYCVCLENNGVVGFTYSGQTCSNNPKKIYFTDDKKAIVVNNIIFPLYDRGEVIECYQKWETILEYEVSKREFDIAKAVLGYTIKLTDLSRKEISVKANGTVWTKKGKPKRASFTYDITSGSLPKYRRGEVAAAYGLQFGVDVLERIANAIEDTYVKFIFEKSDLGNHRASIFGGSSSVMWGYHKCDFIGRDWSLHYDYYDKFHGVDRDYKSVDNYLKACIEYHLDKIKKHDSRARLLVREEDLWLKRFEHYDLIVHLCSNRNLKKYQTALYSRDKQLVQKPIKYGKESYVIAKRGLNSRTDLIELFYDIEFTEGSDKVFALLEQTLQDANDNKRNINLADIRD